MATAKNRLHVKRLNTVGFVDKGDDPKAEIMFFKRKIEKGIKEEGGKFCVYDESGKKMGEHETREQAEAQMRAMEGHKGMDKGLVARVLKALGLQGNEVDKLLADGAEAAANGQEKTAPTPTEEATMFDVTKLPTEAQAEFKKLSDKVKELEGKLNPPAPAPLPADVQKRIDETEKRAKDAEERVQKLEDQRENETYMAKAKALDLNQDDFGPILRKMAKALTAEEMKTVETTFRGLAEQARQAGLFKEIGRGGTGAATEVEAKVNDLVKAAREKNPTWSHERAHGEIMKSHPDLLRALESERMARTLQTGKGD